MQTSPTFELRLSQVGRDVCWLIYRCSDISCDSSNVVAIVSAVASDFFGGEAHSQKALQTSWNYRSSYSVTLLKPVRDSSPRHANFDLENICNETSSSSQSFRSTRLDNTVTSCPISRHSRAPHDKI